GMRCLGRMTLPFLVQVMWARRILAVAAHVAVTPRSRALSRARARRLGDRVTPPPPEKDSRQRSDDSTPLPFRSSWVRVPIRSLKTPVNRGFFVYRIGAVCPRGIPIGA